MFYTNPILQEDFSDPDAIRVGDDYYLVASSFNYLPGLPVLHSKNLVEWEICSYIYDALPSPYYDTVRHGDGSWAPSIRYHDGMFYCLIPMPDDGIYESHTKDINGPWSPLRLVIKKRGLEDPCPIWVKDKAYMVVGFAKSRAGFNSCLGLYEVDPVTMENIGDYKIIFDGHDTTPTIEGPKFNERNGYFYIMAPAGSVKGGWQVCLRSKNIYGPYEHKVVLFQGDTLVNGPHQGALIDLPDDKWAFIHFQDMRAYGRIVHLEPVVWHNDWPVCGQANDLLLCGVPVETAAYPVDVKTDYTIPHSDDFKGSMNASWQTPANKKPGWVEYTKDGLKAFCVNQIKDLHMQENQYSQKIAYLDFDASMTVSLHLENDLDEVGMMIMGREYRYICVVRRNGKNYLELREGSFSSPDKVLSSELYTSDEITFNMWARNKNLYFLEYALGYNERQASDYILAQAGRWVGARIGFYARGNDSHGHALISSFNIIEKKSK